MAELPAAFLFIAGCPAESAARTTFFELLGASLACTTKTCISHGHKNLSIKEHDYHKDTYTWVQLKEFDMI